MCTWPSLIFSHYVKETFCDPMAVILGAKPWMDNLSIPFTTQLAKNFSLPLGNDH